MVRTEQLIKLKIETVLNRILPLEVHDVIGTFFE